MYMSPISVNPALTACILSPVLGLKITTVKLTTFEISISSWPAPTLSTIIKSYPAASKIRIIFLSDLEMPPDAPLNPNSS